MWIGISTKYLCIWPPVYIIWIRFRYRHRWWIVSKVFIIIIYPKKIVKIGSKILMRQVFKKKCIQWFFDTVFDWSLLTRSLSKWRYVLARWVLSVRRKFRGRFLSNSSSTVSNRRKLLPKWTMRPIFGCLFLWGYKIFFRFFSKDHSLFHQNSEKY